eukprot:Sdes_comp19304_c0_seq2m10414
MALPNNIVTNEVKHAHVQEVNRHIKKLGEYNNDYSSQNIGSFLTLSSSSQSSKSAVPLSKSTSSMLSQANSEGAVDSSCLSLDSASSSKAVPLCKHKYGKMRVSNKKRSRVFSLPSCVAMLNNLQNDEHDDLESASSDVSDILSTTSSVLLPYLHKEKEASAQMKEQTILFDQFGLSNSWHLIHSPQFGTYFGNSVTLETQYEHPILTSNISVLLFSTLPDDFLFPSITSSSSSWEIQNPLLVEPLSCSDPFMDEYQETKNDQLLHLLNDLNYKEALEIKDLIHRYKLLFMESCNQETLV